MIANANSIRIPLLDGSVHMCVTSPPFYGLRDYSLPPTLWPAVTYTPMPGLAPVTVPGCAPDCEHVWSSKPRMLHTGSSASDKEKSNAGAFHGDQATTDHWCQRCGGWRGCLGLEPTPEMFVGHIVAIFREVHRVLRDDGTVWCNLGDSYASSGTSGHQRLDELGARLGTGGGHKHSAMLSGRAPTSPGLKPKDLCGIPWRVAFALQADGWYLRNDIIWHKPNPMPESVTDRCTKAHEYVFLLAKSKTYFYDNDAVREATQPDPRDKQWGKTRTTSRHDHKHDAEMGMMQTRTQADGFVHMSNPLGRNRRTVWTIATRAYRGAHFATFPPALVAPCILAGTSQCGVCPECGAPWKRVVNLAKRINTRPGNPMKNDAGRNDSDVRNKRYVSTYETTGWRPTCNCYNHRHCVSCGIEMSDYEIQYADRLDCGHNICSTCLLEGEALDHECKMAPVPAIVLDHFCGSGTTGEVCRETGRRFVGLDLSACYLRDFALVRAEHKQTAASIEAMPLFDVGPRE